MTNRYLDNHFDDWYDQRGEASGGNRYLRAPGANESREQNKYLIGLEAETPEQPERRDGMTRREFGDARRAMRRGDDHQLPREPGPPRSSQSWPDEWDTPLRRTRYGIPLEDESTYTNEPGRTLGEGAVDAVSSAASEVRRGLEETDWRGIGQDVVEIGKTAIKHPLMWDEDDRDLARAGAHSAFQAVARLPADAASGLGRNLRLYSYRRGNEGALDDKNWLERAGEVAAEKIEGVAPIPEGHEEHFITGAGSAIGSMAGFAGLGLAARGGVSLAARGLGAGRRATDRAAGAAQFGSAGTAAMFASGEEAYQRAKAFADQYPELGIGEDEALEAAGKATMTGWIQVTNLNRIIGPMLRVGRPATVKRLVSDLAAAGASEFTLEGVEAVLQNRLEQEYNIDRRLMDGVLQRGGWGALGGVAMRLALQPYAKNPDSYGDQTIQTVRDLAEGLPVDQVMADIMADIDTSALSEAQARGEFDIDYGRLGQMTFERLIERDAAEQSVNVGQMDEGAPTNIQGIPMDGVDLTGDYGVPMSPELGQSAEGASRPETTLESGTEAQPAGIEVAGDSLITGTDGKPFRSKLDARKFMGRKMTVGRPVRVQGGWAIDPSQADDIIETVSRDELPEGFDDPRLMRGVYRSQLSRMPSELTRGGGVELQPRPGAKPTNRKPTGDLLWDYDPSDLIRTPSLNPPWFQGMAAEFGVTTRQVANATKKALRGERLGSKQQTIIGLMLDEIQNRRTNVDPEYGPEYQTWTEMLQSFRSERADRRRAERGELTNAEVDAMAEAMERELEGLGNLYEAEAYAEEMAEQDRQLQDLALDAMAEDEARAIEALKADLNEIETIRALWAISQGETDGQGDAGLSSNEGSSAEATGDPEAEGNQAEAQETETEGEPEASGESESEALRKQIAALEREIRTDSLTGLMNRTAFDQDEAQGQADYYVQMDIDGLGWINDNIGHAAADQVLKALGQRMLDSGLPIYRTGGDEFVIRAESESVRAEVDALLSDLQGVTFTFRSNSGTEYTIHGIPMSYGAGETFEAADEATNQSKRERAESGLRARRKGDQPPNITPQNDRRAPLEQGSEGLDPDQGRVPERPDDQDLAGAVDKTAQAKADADRARQEQADQSPDMLEGDGDLFAGPRPDQSDMFGPKEIETAAAEVETSPSEAQIEAGNYKKGHVRINGLDITIENPRGSVRSGQDRSGKRWEQEMAHHYGYIKRTSGADGEHVDVFLGPEAENPDLPVFVVDQVTAEGSFDEHKVMIGFRSKGAARKGYRDNYEKGYKVGPITSVSLGEFKLWLDQGDLSDPFVQYARDNEIALDGAYPGVEKFDQRDAESAPDRFDEEQDWSYQSENIPDPGQTVNANKRAGETITPEQAKQIRESWKAEAQAMGESMDNSNKVVISLFDASGEISRPWREAGFDVRQYDIKLGDDLLEQFPMGDLVEMRNQGKEIVGVIAQPPCTCFSSSGARWWKTRHDKHDRALVNKMFGPRASRYFSRPVDYTRALVSLTDMLIGEAKAAGNMKFSVVENPVGRIAKEVGLPKPTLVFDPNIYGDPYTKKTQLWGEFNTSLPTANVEPTQGSLMHKLWSSAEKGGGMRSLTPEGFAYSLFMANKDAAAGTSIGNLEQQSAEIANVEGDGDVVDAAGPTSETKTGGNRKPSGNTIFTDDAAERARERLKKKLGQLNTGIDPEMMQDGITLAGYHIEKGARRFSDFARAMIEDLGEAVRPYLKSWYMGVKYDPRAAEFDGMDDPATVDSTDIETITEEAANEPDRSSDPNLEPDSGDAEAPVGLGQEGVQPERPGDRSPGEQGVPETGADARPGGGSLLPGPEAAPSGESGNLELYSEPARPEFEVGPAGGGDGGRGDSAGYSGPPIEPESAETVEGSTGNGLTKAQRLKAQRKANRAGQQGEGREAIDKELPMLFEGQRQDVEKAANRFDGGGYGMLFTNGTGTGKTFTGLGVIRYLANRGRADNVLLVAPSDKVIDDWINSGEALGLSIKKLKSTRDNGGSGIVITTYENLGANKALVRRDWDLLVADEAHKLMQGQTGEVTSRLRAFRSNALHPESVFDRTERLHPELFEEADSIRKRLDSLRAEEKDLAMQDPRLYDLREQVSRLNERQRAVAREIEQKREEVQLHIEASQNESRPRALFLSATPFAYEKNIEWGSGFLFDYTEPGQTEKESRGYNQPDAREKFFVQHFGYRMRYNKLTEPDAKVNRSLMQRQFNSWLRKKGSLSSRMLEVDADYDRRFILTKSAIGTRIDEALDWFSEYRDQLIESGQDTGGIDALSELVKDQFDYLSRMYLLEAIKAREVVPHVREHLAMGRKVLIFHDYKKGGGINPFRFSKGRDLAYNRAVAEFEANFRDLIDARLHTMANPIMALSSQFPDLLLFNGSVPKKKRLENARIFNDDETGPQVMLLQSAAGKEGISLHDTTGKHQRVLINLGLPVAPTTAIQQEGRIYRTGQVSNAIFRYMNTGTNWEKWAFATTIAGRASTAENLSAGEQARALRDAFIEAFEDSDDYRAGMENEGIGGKARDRAANEALTEFDRAKTMYWGQLKKTSKTKAAEGEDYFATPEPLGLKMVEWAGPRPGESMLEPSAGHGAIARWMPENVNRTAIEPSRELVSRLAMSFDGAKRNEKFEDLHLTNKFDGVVMNPPFGRGGKLAVEHLDKATRHLRDGGRVVAIIPRGPAADKRFDKWLYEENEKGKSVRPDIHLSASIELPPSTFERAGTSVSARVVIIDKGQSIPQKTIDLSNAKDVDELFDRIEDLEIARPEPEGQRQGPGRQRSEAESPAGAESTESQGLLRTRETRHAQKGIDLFVVELTRRVDGGTFTELRQIAKRHGGYYSRYNKQGAIPGFQFESEESRSAFLERAGRSGIAEEFASYSTDERTTGTLPTGERKSRFGRLQPTNVAETGPGAVQGDLFLDAREGQSSTAQKRRKIAERVKSAQVGVFRSGIDRVENAGQAAHVVAPLRKESDEVFGFLVTGSDQKPIAFLSLTRGGPSASQVYMNRIGELYRIPGAAEVWAVHNHPSGSAPQSGADHQMNGLFDRVLDGTGLRYRGSVVVAPTGRYSFVAADGRMREGAEDLGDTIPAARRNQDVPVRQTKLRGQPAQGETIDGPGAAKKVVRMELNGRSGVVLLDTKHRVMEVIEMTPDEMQKLRTGDPETGFGELAAAISATNAQAAFVADLTQDINRPLDTKHLVNVGSALKALDIRPLDLFNLSYGEMVSHAEHGYATYESNFYSRGEGAGTTREAIISSLSQRAQKALIDSGLITITDTPAEWPGIHPSDAAAAYMGGKVYMAARNIQPGNELGLILHEIGVHRGLESMIGEKDYARLVNRLKSQVRRGGRVGAGRAAREAYEAHQRAKADDTITSDSVLWEETIAYMAEAGAQSSLLQEIVALIKRALRRIGLAKDFTAADVAHLARGSVRRQVAKRLDDGALATTYAPTMYQRVFHGTPHTFDRFSLDAIGTGEGAQAYGWGLYFASKRGVAEFYRDGLTDGNEKYYYDGELVFEKTDNGRPADITDVRRAAVFYLADSTRDSAIRELMDPGDVMPPDGSWSARVIEEIKRLDPQKVSRVREGGSLYEANIPDDSELLDWDAPLSEQPEGVSQKARAAMRERGFTEDQIDRNMQNRGYTGSSLYAGIASFYGEREASMLLNKHGIPGLRYLDGTSRDGSGDSRNYVIWDENVVTIEAVNDELVQAEAQYSRTDQTQTPEFKRWFGDSKVVDYNGEPLVLYHGTAEGFDAADGLSMVWGSADPRLANDYAAMNEYRRGSSSVMPIYMRVENPFDADLGLPKTVTAPEFVNAVIEQAQGSNESLSESELAETRELLGAIKQAARREESGPHYGRHDFWYEPESLFGKDGADALRRIFQIAGFDGIRMIENGAVTYGAFRPEQIKSATGNTGAFDPENPDIRYSRRRQDNDNEWSFSMPLNDGAKGHVADPGDSSRPARPGKEVFSTTVFLGRDSDGKVVEARTSDPSLREQGLLKRYAKRLFTKEGQLHPQAFARHIEAQGVKNADELDIQFFTADLVKQAKRGYKNVAWTSIPEGSRQAMNEYLAGRKAKDIPKVARDALDVMRGALDRMSSRLQTMLADEVRFLANDLSEDQHQVFLDNFDAARQGDEEALAEIEALRNGEAIARRARLIEIIEGNKGEYLNRSYRVFDDSGWTPPDDVVERAREFLTERVKADPEFADLSEDGLADHVSGIINAITKNRGGSLVSMISSGILGRKDLSVLKKRKEIAPEIRALMGEYRDPRVNFARSMSKMSYLVGNHHFLASVRRDGLGKFLSTHPSELMSEKITDSGDPTMLPLGGLYAAPEFAQALRDYVSTGTTEGWLKAAYGANAAVKYGKTVLSPTTSFRNFYSASMFTVMNGHFDWRYSMKAAQHTWADLFSNNQDRHAYIRRLVELGVLHDNPRSGELVAAIEDAMEIDPYAGGLLKRAAKAPLRVATKIYRAGDDFWKIIGFENERASLLKAGVEASEAEAMAARRIRDGYPTYSMVPEAVRWLRRFPLAGTFVSFPWEIMRTTGNQIEIVREDFAAGRNAMAAKRLLGMTVAGLNTYVISAILMSMFGIDDEEDEAIRELAAPWQRNSQFAYLWPDDEGHVRYLDLSHLDPYTYLKMPLEAIRNGANDTVAEKVGEALKELLEPFIGSDIAATAIGEAAFNKRLGSGQPIYDEDAVGQIEKWGERAKHIWESVRPGFAANIDRTLRAASGEVTSYGKEYDLFDEALGWVGFRLTTSEPEVSLTFRADDFRDAYRQSLSPVYRKLRDPNPIDDGEIRKAAEQANARWAKAFEDLHTAVRAARVSGLDDRELRKILDDGGVPKRHIPAVVNLRIPRWRPDPQTVRSSAALALEGRSSRIDRAEFARRRRELMEAVREIQRRRDDTR